MLIPFRSDRPRLRPSYLTVALIVVNMLIHFYSMALPTVTVPIRIEGQTFNVEQARLHVQYGLYENHPTFLTLFTHQFLHGGVFHLFGNMLFLWLFGSLIEDAIRPWGLAALYLGGGVAAALANIGMSRALGNSADIPMVGASGAIAAIMGLFMLRFYKTRLQFFFILYGTFWTKAIWALPLWVGMEVLDGIQEASNQGGGVAHWAHVGGFVTGALVAPFVGSISAAKQEYVLEDAADNVEYLRRAEEAAAAERALRANPNNAHLMRRLAQAYRHAGQYEQATQTYRRCLSSFVGRGMLEPAADVFLELIDYGDATGITPEVQLKLARQLEAIRPQLAVTIYTTLCKQHPETREGEFALLRLAAITLQRFRQIEDGRRYLEQFLERYPNSQWAAEARQALQSLGERGGPAGGMQS